MSVDLLQEKIRKTKNPTVLELNLAASDLPGFLLEEEGSASKAYSRFCREILEELRSLIPAVRLSFSAFSYLGHDGLYQLSETLKQARALGYYVLLDTPEILSPGMAKLSAQMLLGEESLYPCDGLVIGGYLGSDVIRPFLPYCKKEMKDIFVVVRTGNKSAPELQDLLAGSRLVHTAAADHVNRYGADTSGKFGYTRVGVMSAAGSAESLRTLRMKYPKLFLLVDGYDYPNGNAKNCAGAFDRLGHGAAVCGGNGITCAWKDSDSNGRAFAEEARASAERMKRNLTRYVTIL